jgi:hypothetical protein
MGFAGGGFFGSGADQSEAFNLPQTKSDNLATDASSASAPVITFQDNRQMSGKKVHMAGDGPKVDITMNQTDHGAIQQALGFAGEASAMNAAVQSEFLGAVSNFADLSATLQAEQMASSERQAQSVIDAVGSSQREANVLISDIAGEAFENNQFALEWVGKMAGDSADYNRAALEQVAAFGQASQNASETALDYVFEASKSEQAELTEMLSKWGIGAAVLVVGMMLYAGVSR